MLEVFAYLLVATVCAPFVLAFLMGSGIILTFVAGCVLIPYSLFCSKFKDN